MAKKKTTIQYFGGIPTEPDVRSLNVEFGVPKEGQQITYDSVENIIDCEAGSSRWQTITNAWRRQLYRDHNLVTYCTKNDQGDRCFVVADPSQRVNVSSAKIKTGVRSIKRGGHIATTTDMLRLSGDELRVAQHNAHILNHLALAEKTQPKKII